MRTIIHISDLHFGRDDKAVQDGLLADIERLKPSLVVVSGDLTQRALIRQFQQARAYLSRIPFPLLVVPGNHDVPFFDVTRRFFLPLSRYKYYIHHDVNPVYVDEEIAVMGLNTARSFTIQNGRVSRRQLERMERFFAQTPSVTRIVVLHHPLTKPPQVRKRKKVLTGATDVLRVLERCKVDLVLTGHFHHRFRTDVRDFHPDIQHPITIVHAGTAISKRLKEGMNTYNVITITDGTIDVAMRGWDGSQFRTLEERQATPADAQKA